MLSLQDGLHSHTESSLDQQGICHHVLVPGGLHVLHLLPGHQDGADHVQVGHQLFTGNNFIVFVCSVGYSDELAGLACTTVIIVGAGGTVLFGVLAQKTGKIVEITKLCCFGAIVCVLVLSYLLLMPDVGVYILISGGFLGLFALGVFPLALELTVEAIFPANQATVTCFIFLFFSIQGVFLMVIENWLGYPLPEK